MSSYTTAVRVTSRAISACMYDKFDLSSNYHYVNHARCRVGSRVEKSRNHPPADS